MNPGLETISRQSAQHAPASPVQGLLDLGQSLRAEGRCDEALVIFEHLSALFPRDENILSGRAMTLGALGRILESLEILNALKPYHTNIETLLSLIREQSVPAIAKFNSHLAAGEVEQAEPYAAALAALIPQNAAILHSALACNQALGRFEDATKYARALLALEPEHAMANAVLASANEPEAGHEQEIERRVTEALAERRDVHPMIRLRDIHDAASAILCGELGEQGARDIERLLAAARAIAIDAQEGSDLQLWEKHYRLLLDAVDLPAIFAPTPKALPDSGIEFMRADGSELDWQGLAATAKRLGAEAVFFAAADENYVNLYARWYALSILKFCDVPCLVVVHVIGGAGKLRKVAEAAGIEDERLIFAGDGFERDAVKTKCYDSPPKGLIAHPVAHFQSVRFLRLGALSRKLALPVFVSDIDLLLQRGVRDLLERSAGADVVLNENGHSAHAGSRLTANLLLVNPTESADIFLRALRAYLENALNRNEVTRWIDQMGLLIARHHLLQCADKPRIAYFDTNSDINNVMYRSYQDHPFRFLSLYHGFDTSSLEGNPSVLGSGTAQAA